MVELTTTGGTAFEVYAVGAEEAPRGILIVHDWWGLRQYNRQWAGRFADRGYRAVVVDLYDGQVPSDPADAGEIMRSVDQDEADGKLRAALEFVKRPKRKVATLGWSFGGVQALRAALLEPEAVCATIMYYSRIITDVTVLQSLRAPVLAIFSERERTWQEKQAKFKQAMTQAGGQLEVASYPAEHGFVNPDSEHYDAEATHAAWELTVSFLDRHLGTGHG